MGENFDEVLANARQGDNWAVESVFERYKGLVRAKSRSYFLVGADVEDLIQEGMIGLYKAIRDFRPEKHASFSAFANICVTRQIITAVKTATRQKHAPLNTYISLNKPYYDSETEQGEQKDGLYLEFAAPGPEELLIDRERGAGFMADVRNLLSDMEITTLSLYLDGATYSEISSRLKKPEKSVDNALQRVKRKLVKYLATVKET